MTCFGVTVKEDDRRSLSSNLVADPYPFTLAYFSVKPAGSCSVCGADGGELLAQPPRRKPASW